MDRLLKAELQLALENSIFWTDRSASVLKYIQNENKRFKTFVANRMNTIREITKVKQWRHIDTKQNPADCTSRGLKASALLNSSTWLNGPDYLKLQESEWPNSDITFQTCDDDDVEVRKDVLIMNTIVKEQNPIHTFIHYHSKWNKLTRVVAWLLKLKEMLLHLSQKRKEILANVSITDSNVEKQNLVQRKIQTIKKCMNVQPISLDDVKAAENAIICFAQMEGFPEETETLQKGNTCISCQSSICKLDPIV